jgi:hypothetical protein
MDESGERPHDGVLGAQFESDAEFAREMARLAGLYVDRAKAAKTELDFSDESIESADAIGLQLYAALPRDVGGPKLEELRSGLASELGAYFGETFIKNHGGRWGWIAASGNRVFGLRTGADINAFPLVKARKRLQGAEHDNLAVLYSFLRRWPSTQAKRRSIGFRLWGRRPPGEPVEQPAGQLADAQPAEAAEEPAGELAERGAGHLPADGT